MKKVLWIGDAACPSGFARATHEILERLRKEFEIAVIGMNYRGDSPSGYPYPIYQALANQEPFGLHRLHWVCNREKPDLIIIQQDGWNIPFYMRLLRAKKENGEYHHPSHAAIPVVTATPVDGKNFQGQWLDGVEHAVFWTKFGKEEAYEGGYTGTASVIPLGVDLTTYYPVEKQEALAKLKISMLRDNFIVGNVNRNQPRKRWDLSIKYFAEWVRTYKVKDAILFLHAAPTGDAGIDVQQLARYHGVYHMMAMREPPPYEGETDEVMRCTYSCFDIGITTTQGEGFGLTTLEAMACGVPAIVPGWAALGEWAARGAWVVPCTSTVVGSPYVNVIGGVPDETSFIRAMQKLYVDARARGVNRQAALECAQQPCYRWDDIGEEWITTLKKVLQGSLEAAS